ncbi:hypothetical protein SH449x_002066 [Pirellulaceae bacterium SH449]
MNLIKIIPPSLQMKHISMSPRLVVLAMILLSSVCGCQPFMNKKSVFPWGRKKDAPKVIPDRILAVWTDTVLHQQGQPGVRGFGGRVYFYEKEKTDPIEVEGSLAVYAFDADNDAIDSQKPLRKFVFTTEQLADSMSKTSMGPSYNIWLPWSAVGEPAQKLSLITRFEGVEGGTTISDPVIKLLPGVAKKSDTNGKGTRADESKSASDQGVQQASFSEAKELKSSESEKIRPIETIELPPGFQRHLLDSQSMRKGLDANSLDSIRNNPSMANSVTSTQVFDAKNSTPRWDSSAAAKSSGSNEGESEARLFSSSRPDRSNIRQGSWLKAEKRLKDGIQR